MPACFRLFGPKTAPLSRNRVKIKWFNFKFCITSYFTQILIDFKVSKILQEEPTWNSLSRETNKTPYIKGKRNFHATMRSFDVKEFLLSVSDYYAYVLVWWQLWNFIVWKLKFKRFLHPNERPYRIFWYTLPYNCIKTSFVEALLNFISQTIKFHHFHHTNIHVL